ncbi:MAG: hypothetical protein AAF602_17950 [Myxococcota bacterium]
MNALFALCDQIHDSPDDENPWLVLGDALLDRGDPRGELIHLTSAESVRLRERRRALASPGKPRTQQLFSRTSLRTRLRIAELIDEVSWTDALELPRRAASHPIVWHRGAVEWVGLSRASASEARSLFDAFEGHWSGRLCQRLRFVGGPASYRSAEAFVQHPGFRRLRALSIDDGPVLEQVLANPMRLTELELRGFSMSEGQLRRLLVAPWLPQLHSLTLGVELPDTHPELLASCSRLDNLRRLGGPIDRPRLAGSPWLANCHVCVWQTRRSECERSAPTFTRSTVAA